MLPLVWLTDTYECVNGVTGNIMGKFDIAEWNREHGGMRVRKPYGYSYEDIGELVGVGGKAVGQWMRRNGLGLTGEAVEDLERVVEYVNHRRGSRSMVRVVERVVERAVPTPGPLATLPDEVPVVRKKKSAEEVRESTVGKMNDAVAAFLGDAGGLAPSVELVDSVEAEVDEVIKLEKMFCDNKEFSCEEERRYAELKSNAVVWPRALRKMKR